MDDYLIGIDPGVKTGLAVWNRRTRKFEVVRTTTICAAQETIRAMVARGNMVEVRIEDARQRKWFGRAGRERLKGVGSVNRDCSIWQEFCEHYGIKYVLVHPKDNTTKVQAEYFNRVTGWSGRSSEHSRDAGMLVVGG